MPNQNWRGARRITRSFINSLTNRRREGCKNLEDKKQSRLHRAELGTVDPEPGARGRRERGIDYSGNGGKFRKEEDTMEAH